MSKLFMRGTQLETAEVMMVSIPNFDERTSGLYMSNSKNIRASGKCIYCADYRKNKGCKHTHCPYLLERAEMGSVEYKEIVTECIKGIISRGFKRRIDYMVKSFDGGIFLNEEHKYNFNSALREIKLVHDNSPAEQMAAIYMLTANSKLWRQVQDGIYPRSSHKFLIMI